MTGGSIGMTRELRTAREVFLAERPPFPHNMLVELTNSCNHKCVFCNHQNMRRRKKLCDMPFTFDIMKQAYENGTREIGFYLVDEPFLNPDMEKYIAYAHELEFEYIYLTTNGSLATLERMKRVINAGLNSIKFSVNAATPEIYEKIHGKNDYLTVKENICALRQYVAENGIDLSIFLSFVRTEITKGEVDRLRQDFEGIVDKVYIYDCGNEGVGMPDMIRNGLVSEGNLKLCEVPCNMVFNRLHITCEGYLNACCADVHGVLAAVDLHHMTLVDAWYSDIMVDLRRRFLNNQLEGTACYNCANNADLPVVPLNPALYQEA